MVGDSHSKRGLRGENRWGRCPTDLRSPPATIRRTNSCPGSETRPTSGIVPNLRGYPSLPEPFPRERTLRLARHGLAAGALGHRSHASISPTALTKRVPLGHAPYGIATPPQADPVPAHWHGYVPRSKATPFSLGPHPEFRLGPPPPPWQRPCIPLWSRPSSRA